MDSKQKVDEGPASASPRFKNKMGEKEQEGRGVPALS